MFHTAGLTSQPYGGEADDARISAGDQQALRITPEELSPSYLLPSLAKYGTSR
jgi:hypothetical protein